MVTSAESALLDAKCAGRDRSIMAEAGVRLDLFRDVKPYYDGNDWFEQRENVPTLFSISINKFMVDGKLNYEPLPTVLKAKLDSWQDLRAYKGPKVMKCSRCSKFYTKPDRFAAHKCE